MITLQHVFYPGRRDVRGLRAAQRCSTAPIRKRFGNAAFWGLIALSLLAGTWLGDFANGLLVLGLAGARRLRLHRPRHAADDERARSAAPGRAATATGCSCRS